MTHNLADVIKDTTQEVFEIAGGFEFTDEIAVKLNNKWRDSQSPGPVIVSASDLAWLIDGYARARLSMPTPLESDDGD